MNTEVSCTALPSRDGKLTLDQLVAPFRSDDKQGQMEILTRHCSSLPGQTDEFAKAIGAHLSAKPRIDPVADEHAVLALRIVSPFAPGSVPSIVQLLGRGEVRADQGLSRQLLDALFSYRDHSARCLLPYAEAIGKLLESDIDHLDSTRKLFETLTALGAHSASQTPRIIRLFQEEEISEEDLQRFVQALGGTGDEQLVEALADLTEDDYGSRYECGITMACGELSVIGIMALGDLLKTDESGPLRRVLYALQSYGARPGFELEHAQAREYLPRMVELLDHETYPVPLFAIQALQRLARPDDAEAVAGLSEVLLMKLDEEAGEAEAEMVAELKRAASKALFLIFNKL